MARSRTATLIGLALLGVASTGANAATTLYENNFEAGWLDWRWTADSRISQDANVFSFFNGWHSNTASEFRVVQPDLNLASGNFVEYTVEFDLYAFDSWDGTAGGDRFQVLVNGVTRFDHSLSNGAAAQTSREPDVARSNLGGRTSAPDAIYRDIRIKFAAPIDDTKIRVRFQDGGLGGLNDESWGIDNFKVSYEVVPTPGTAGLALMGGLLIAGRRKR